MTDSPEPITLAQARDHLRIDEGAEDEQISDLIVAAREHVEDYTGLVLTVRPVTETVASLGRWIDLSSWPVNSVDAIWCSVGGVPTRLAPEAYGFSFYRRPFRIVPMSTGWGIGAGFPDASRFRRSLLPVEIDITAGYATPADVPQAVKQAMLLLIGHFYSNRRENEVGLRAAAVSLPLGVAALLRRHRKRSL